MFRRLHLDQPDSFAFTPDNLKWAQAQITKYPEGRQASAIIPLLWRAQEQEGWLTRPALELVADMLGLAYIRALEVASFYYMFKLKPVGSVANIQICGTTSCMICGAEDLVSVCRAMIAPNPLEISADGKLTWEEVECLGACSNAPMAQIGKDYYEDLTVETMTALIEALTRGEVPVPGPQNGRYAAEPLAGLTTLKEYESDKNAHNASVQRAIDLGDTVKRIDGTEVPLLAPWKNSGVKSKAPGKKAAEKEAASDPTNPAPTPGPKPSAKKPANKSGITKQQADAASKGKPTSKSNPEGATKTTKTAPKRAKAASKPAKSGESKPRAKKAAPKSDADDV